ncbi:MULTISPECIES: glycosyltransferase [Lactococcus]|uniref:Glycosyltransferase n=1 Tax=Lactococcus lactis subsp. cremoris TaxID=1359 RepID=A0A1V0PD48_LACLC|nr:glycosyltransferase [Lactococcus cremoris]ARE27126.1 glycosyltransferase [Lactococcus cremoris]KZK52244.1 Glycosyl transferase CpsG [Lactococcus cremoris]WMB98728.1 glycosyltransferase [Lactococcus cremoris]
MIFVTVGTHEQGFDRLIKKLDQLKEKGLIKQEIVIQKGYTEYAPKYCQAQKFYSPVEMNELFKDAKLIITHGGPATYMSAIALGKPTIVVPRLRKYNEHVNNHQLDFAYKVNETGEYNLNIVTEMSELYKMIDFCLNRQNKQGQITSHTQSFNSQFSHILESLL